MCEGREWGEGGGWALWGGVGRHHCDGSGRRWWRHVEERPVVRSIVVARRGSGGGTWQGVVRVARVRCARDVGGVKVVGGCGGVAWGSVIVMAAAGGGGGT